MARPAWAPEWVRSHRASLLLFAGGVLSAHEVSHALASLGPTVGFLAALLVLAAECGRGGVFDALGEKLALGAGDRPRRLLALVFCGGGSDHRRPKPRRHSGPADAARVCDGGPGQNQPAAACVRLLTSRQQRIAAAAGVNLTNLLAFQASHVSFARFAELMVLPWFAALALEWLGLMKAFAPELSRASPERSEAQPRRPTHLPAFPLLNAGPNLTYTGSLATLLWRRVMRSHEEASTSASSHGWAS